MRVLARPWNVGPGLPPCVDLPVHMCFVDLEACNQVRTVFRSSTSSQTHFRWASDSTRASWGASKREGLWFGNLRVMSLFSFMQMMLLCWRHRTTTVWLAATMTVSTPKSEVLYWWWWWAASTSKESGVLVHKLRENGAQGGRTADQQ